MALTKANQWIDSIGDINARIHLAGETKKFEAFIRGIQWEAMRYAADIAHGCECFGGKASAEIDAEILTHGLAVALLE